MVGAGALVLLKKRPNSADRERSEAAFYKVGGRSFRRVGCWSLLLAAPGLRSLGST
jgi:hypothetical protein